MCFGRVHHFVHVFAGADIAGIDAQAFHARLQGGDSQPVVEVDIRDERPKRAARMARRAPAAASSGTARRTASQPLAAKRSIWARVASTSRVSVLVMLWTMTGAPPARQPGRPAGWRGFS